MIEKILRSTLTWLTFCGLMIGLSVVPSAARGAQPRSKSHTKKTATAKTATAKTETSNASHKGMVWVNPKTKIFHREGDRWYGKSKDGKYMTEAEAMKEGYRPAKPPHQLSHAKKKQ